MSLGESLSELQAVLDEAAGAGWCEHPVRLAGRLVHHASGEIERGLLVTSCKDRRAVRCPACSRRYKADAWHLVAAGIVGGKGVPERVAGHPMLFATLTAPSFGRVHSRPHDPVRRAHCTGPSERRCRHGRPRSCGVAHAPGDPLFGAPLCPDCYDTEGAVLFNAHVPLLWNRTSVAIVRELAREAGTSERRLRQLARLSYLKVAEFQRRGSVHLHVLLRLDVPDGPSGEPPAGLSGDVLERAVRAAVARVQVTLPAHGGHGHGDGRRPARGIGWGRELEVDALFADGTSPEAVASYVAKYTTKDVDDDGLLARPIRSLRQLEALGLPGHLEALARAAWHLGDDPDLAELRLRARAHRLGYPGHVQSKSRAYSTTLTALRGARRDWARSRSPLPEGFDGAWRYVGRGYVHAGAARLAETLARDLDASSTAS
ncbi:MAG: replication initiation protein [Actinomycetota bacterium]|nr:replication initiation protein [Actinomycetota bacterium]